MSLIRPEDCTENSRTILSLSSSLKSMKIAIFYFSTSCVTETEGGGCRQYSLQWWMSLLEQINQGYGLQRRSGTMERGANLLLAEDPVAQLLLSRMKSGA